MTIELPSLSPHKALQNFDTTTTPQQGVEHLLRLRKVLSEQGLSGLIIPHEDEHQNEYLPEANERLAWATGFTGSAGAAIILLDQAVVFADGRYTIQAQEQTDRHYFVIKDYTATALSDFIKSLKSGLTLGYDARLHSPDGLKSLKMAANQAGIVLKSCVPNPLDSAWGLERPSAPMAMIVPHPQDYAGIASTQKRHEIALDLKARHIEAAWITAPSSIAWLFNIRGADVIRSPLPLGQALLRADGSAHLFIEPKKISPDLIEHLGNEVAVAHPQEIDQALSALKGKAVAIDGQVSSAFWLEALERNGAISVISEDPCALPKARKNDTEIAGTKAAHIRDGAILTTFLHWLATEAQETLPTEIEVAQKLEALRHESGLLKDLSFDTISGFGPHGALPHYRVTRASDLKCQLGNLLLVDSGAQYLDGTTDVTRTVAIGTPTQEHRRLFTLVLKGHIALATIRFPKGTTGTHLDILARQFLWQAGFDYDHGTGHGVGVYLGVHEGPQRISKALNKYALEPGMIVSNEPGYYKAGDYGIRIENLQFVTPAQEISGGERPMLGFECLTLAPLDRHLIELDLLSATERDYVNSYHQCVLEKIAPLVNSEVAAWLKRVCQPL